MAVPFWEWEAVSRAGRLAGRLADAQCAYLAAKIEAGGDAGSAGARVAWALRSVEGE